MGYAGPPAGHGTPGRFVKVDLHGLQTIEAASVRVCHARLVTVAIDIKSLALCPFTAVAPDLCDQDLVPAPASVNTHGRDCSHELACAPRDWAREPQWRSRARCEAHGAALVQQPRAQGGATGGRLYRSCFALNTLQLLLIAHASNASDIALADLGGVHTRRP